MRRKGIAVLVSALMLAVSLTGCGKQEVLDGTEAAATLDDTTSMTLGEFNLMLRYQEAQMETYYGAMFGTSNIYAQDMSGTGEIYGETAKDSLVSSLRRCMCWRRRRELWSGADRGRKGCHHRGGRAVHQRQYREDAERPWRGSDFRGATAYPGTIQNKMYDALTADVDTEVSDEEAAQKRIAYVYLSTAGTETDEEGNTSI